MLRISETKTSICSQLITRLCLPYTIANTEPEFFWKKSDFDRNFGLHSNSEVFTESFEDTGLYVFVAPRSDVPL